MRTPSVGGGIKWYFTINENGSVCPAGLPIVQNGNRYTLTGDIEGSLKILRDNIVVDGTGHRIFGNGSAMGGGNVVINGRDHVIFMNAVVSGFFGTGISLGSFDVNRSNSMIGSSNCLVANNTITGGSPSYCFSIWVEGLNNSIINNRIVGNNGIGVLIERGSHHLVANNLIEDNGMYGIGFEMGQATVKGNRLNNNAGGAFYFTDSNMGLITPIQEIDSSNLVEGKPAYYWVNQNHKSVPSDAGYVLLVNCSDITVSGLNIDKGGRWNSYGITLIDTVNSAVTSNVVSAGSGIEIVIYRTTGACNVLVAGNTVSTGLMAGGGNITIIDNVFTNIGIIISSDTILARNNISSCDTGISLHGTGSRIFENKIVNCARGISLFNANNNTIYHNNFLNNSRQAYIDHAGNNPEDLVMYHTYYPSENNTWDSGYRAGGNYWSNYNGVDANSDGLGDTLYKVFENDTDNYPLMKPYEITAPASSSTLSPSSTLPSATSAQIAQEPASRQKEKTFAWLTIAPIVAVAFAVVSLLVYHRKHRTSRLKAET